MKDIVREIISVEEALAMTPAQKYRRILQMYGLSLRDDLVRGSPDELIAWADLGRRDLFFMATVILGWNKPTMTGFHYAMCDFIEQGSRKAREEGEWHGFNNSPREHLKTTFGMAWVIQNVVTNPNNPILITSAVKHQADATSDVIKRQFENNTVLQDLYPNIQPNKNKWKGNAFRLIDTFNPVALERREPTVMSVSVGGTPESYHFGIILQDDLVTWKNAGTDGLRSKTRDFYYHCQALLNPYGAELTNGTRFMDDDLYGWMLSADHGVDIDVLDPVWRRVETENEQGRKVFIFPEEFDVERLAAKRAAMSLPAFYSQYYNKTLPPEMQRFKSEFLQYVDELPEEICFYIGVDPSTGLALDKCGIIVIGFDEEENVYPWEEYYGLLTEQQMIAKVDDLNRKYRPRVIETRIETYGYQKSILTGVEAFQREVGRFWNFAGGTGSKQNKAMRIAGVVQPLYERGKVFHNKQLMGGVLERQLLRYGATSENELPDALYEAINAAQDNGWIGDASSVLRPVTSEEKVLAGVRLTPSEQVVYAETMETHEEYERMFGGGSNW